MGTVEELRKNIADAQALLARLEKRPMEPEGFSVITFEVQFKNHTTDFVSGKIYTFAAIHADGHWFTTGRPAQMRFTWDGLFDYFEARGQISNVQVATEFRPVFPTVPEAVHAEVVYDGQNGRKMQAIRRLRNATGMGLREAKYYVEYHAGQYPL